MNYEVQQALSRKVDEWKFHALEQKVDSLERDNRELSTRIGNAEAKLSNHYAAIERLIQLIAENNVFQEQWGELQTLRNYL